MADETIQNAIKHLQRKKGAFGVDKMTPEELLVFWERHGEQIKQDIRKGIYCPRPIKIRYIPKKDKTKKRKLGIPCVLDRMILYAIQSVMTPYFEPSFSDSSFAFRKGLGCLDALEACLLQLNQETGYVVDLDIKSFFDMVDHKVLFDILDANVQDVQLLRLLKKYIKTSVVHNKSSYVNRIGLPQGSAVSPLLANLYLNSFDHYLEKCEIRFVRYADDIVMFCTSEDEAKRCLIVAEKYLTGKLKLKLNQEKTNIVEPEKLTYLGYSFQRNTAGEIEFALDDNTKTKMLEQMQKHIQSYAVSLEEWWKKVGSFNRGWVNYHRYVNPYMMYQFLQYAEQCQGISILDRMSQDEKYTSQEYLKALYDSREYSSLTGWYRRYLMEDGQGKLLERMEKMINKNTKWRSKEVYGQVEQLAEAYPSLIEEPFYCGYPCRIDSITPKYAVTDTMKEERSDIQYQIIGVLAAGKNMTLAQVNCYLILKGINISKVKLVEEMMELVREGIVEMNRICPVKDEGIEIQNTTLISQYVTCFHLCFRAEEYVKKVFAPLDYGLNPHILAGGHGGLIYYYASTILWNQIILNFMLYETSFNRFTIDDVFPNPYFERIEIPLYIETEEGNYLFEYVHTVNPDQIRKRFQQWSMLQKYTQEKIIFVIVAGNFYELYKAKYWIRKEALMNTSIFLDRITFSVAHSWFMEQKGAILTSAEIV